jgi:hypothetical protein
VTVSNSEDVLESLATAILTIDETALDELIDKGVDFGKIEELNGQITTAVNVMAEKGLSEKMRKVLRIMNVLDSLSDNPEKQPKLVLEAACDRSVWNIEMLQVLVNSGKVNVNGQQLVPEQKRRRGRACNLILGPSALHILAQGEYWWRSRPSNILSLTVIDPTARTTETNDRNRGPS